MPMKLGKRTPGTTAACLWLGIALLARCPSLPAEPAPLLPGLDQQSLLANLPGQTPFAMPPKLFTPGLAQDLERFPQLTRLFASLRGQAANASKWTAIPDDQWKRIIREVSPWTVNPRGLPIVCPFCGQRRFTRVTVAENDFLSHPLRYPTPCCGETIYGDPVEMPPDYKAKPNRDIVVPQLDGTDRTYPFFAYEADGGKEKLFLPEGEVWNANLGFLYKAVLPDLMAAVYANKDEKAAVTLCLILDRIAEVYPALPLLETHADQGFACGKDGKSYLTRDEYRSAKRPNPYGTPFYWRNGLNWNKLGPAGGGWQDYVMAAIGNLAEAYALIEEVPAVREYSLKTYGDEAAALARIRERLLKEAAYMMAAVSDTRGNTVISWVYGAIRLGIVLQDPYFFNQALAKFEKTVSNGYYADGLSEQAAFNYAAMMRGFVAGTELVKYFGKFDLDQRYPFLRAIRETTDYPVITLHGVESMHSDQHGRFMTTAATPGGWAERVGIPGNPPLYEKHEKSLNFPEYGLTCLRSGGPGERLEAIVDYQNTVGHKHAGYFNLQLFFEGVNLLPDIGYATGVADISAAPFNGLKYPFELLPPPQGDFTMRGWTWGYSNLPETHCTAAVDSAGGRRGGPVAFERFFGGQEPESPASSLQFLEGRGPDVFNPADLRGGPATGPVERFSRQLTTLALPNGKSVLVDIFRIRGGRRHDLFWHVPAPAPVSTFGPGKPQAGNFAQYREARAFDPREKTSSAASQLTSLNVSPLPPAWQATWAIDPHAYGPVTTAGKAAYEKLGWKDALPKVNLRLWSGVQGTPADGEIIQGKMPWPSRAPEFSGELDKVIAFKDGFDVLVESRLGAAPGLESAFLHVLEPHKASGAPSLAEVTFPAVSGGSSKRGVVVRLVPAGTSSAALFFGSSLDAGTVAAGEFAMKGRAGMIAPEALQANLYDGSEIRAGSMSLRVAPTWVCTLNAVVGDLSGHLQGSALIVSSPLPLPVDATLVGQTITVNHRISPNHRSGYVIHKVSKLASGDYRLDLRGTPPLVHNKFVTVDRDQADPRMFKTDTYMFKGQGARSLMAGRVALFPRTGFASPIQAALPDPNQSAPSDAHADRIVFTTAPTAEQVAVGDGFVVFSIQPGDELMIPSFAAVRPVATTVVGKTVLELGASSALGLRLPGKYRAAILTTGGTAQDVPATRTVDGTSVQLPVLADGRGTMELSRE
jgi:hypothetical protein